MEQCKIRKGRPKGLANPVFLTCVLFKDDWIIILSIDWSESDRRWLEKCESSANPSMWVEVSRFERINTTFRRNKLPYRYRAITKGGLVWGKRLFRIFKVKLPS